VGKKKFLRGDARGEKVREREVRTKDREIGQIDIFLMNSKYMSLDHIFSDFSTDLLNFKR
jgi:hypothetical protein